MVVSLHVLQVILVLIIFSAWYFLCFIFFGPTSIWLLYTLNRTITRKLQFVSHVPHSVGEFRVALEELANAGSLVRPSIGHEEQWPGELEQQGSLQPPHSPLAGVHGRELDSGQTTPTSAAFLAPEHHDAVLSPAVAVSVARQDVDDVEPVVDTNSESHAHHPHDPGGHWEVNATLASGRIAKKLQTAYCAFRLWSVLMMADD